jgi:hypothetical protein
VAFVLSSTAHPGPALTAWVSTVVSTLAMAQAPMSPLAHLAARDAAYVAFNLMVLDVKAAAHPYDAVTTSAPPAKAMSILDMASGGPASATSATNTTNSSLECCLVK